MPFQFRHASEIAENHFLLICDRNRNYVIAPNNPIDKPRHGERLSRRGRRAACRAQPGLALPSCSCGGCYLDCRNPLWSLLPFLMGPNVRQGPGVCSCWREADGVPWHQARCAAAVPAPLLPAARWPGGHPISLPTALARFSLLHFVPELQKRNSYPFAYSSLSCFCKVLSADSRPWEHLVCLQGMSGSQKDWGF